MNIHFGLVNKYFPQKGFGFVSHPLDSKIRQDVFFHIKNVQKSNKDVADKLSSYEASDDVFFYYEAENTPKGEQVKSILPVYGICELLKDNLHFFTQKLEYLWRNIEIPQPVWLCDVTQDLIGHDRLNKLKLEREILNEKKKEAEEIKRKERERVEAERQKQLELQEQQRRIKEEEQERQRKIVEEEFELLVAEMKPKDFTKSWQVSKYIIGNRLGDKYKHLSGVLLMKGRGALWEFNGGISPNVYAELCQRLDLESKKTDSRVVGFTAFKDL